MAKIKSAFGDNTLNQFQARQYSVIPRVDSKGAAVLQDLVRREKESPLLVFNIDSGSFQEISESNIKNVGSGNEGNQGNLLTFIDDVNLTANTPIFVNMPFSMTESKTFFGKAYVGNEEVSIDISPTNNDSVKIESNTTGIYHIVLIAF